MKVSHKRQRYNNLKQPQGKTNTEIMKHVYKTCSPKIIALQEDIWIYTNWLLHQLLIADQWKILRSTSTHMNYGNYSKYN